MKLTAEITAGQDAKELERLFASEEKEFSNGRAEYRLEKKGKDIIFKISAADATAMRAALNSVAKMLVIYEKTKNVISKK